MDFYTTDEEDPQFNPRTRGKLKTIQKAVIIAASLRIPKGVKSVDNRQIVSMIKCEWAELYEP